MKVSYEARPAPSTTGAQWNKRAAQTSGDLILAGGNCARAAVFLGGVIVCFFCLKALGKK